MKTIRNRVVLFAPLLLAVSSAFAQPTVSIEDKTVAESAGVVSLAVALSEVSASDVTVAWSTSDGTAQAGSDYTTASGSLVITAGNLSGTVEVPVLDDSQPELAQDFHVNLSAPMNAVLGDASGKVTISESDVTVLSWDDGSSDLGTAAFQATASPPGSYVFRISSQESADGGWRTALRVDSGNADLYFSAGAIPTTTNHQRASNNAGSDGWVLRPDQYSIGHHYILVQVTQTATWSLYSGNIHVQNLGALQFTDGNGNTTYDIGEAVQGSGSGPVAIGPEGRRFFSNTIPTGTPAWSLWLNGDPRNITVRRALAGFPEGGHDRVKAGHLLLVPDYIGTGSDKYFISVSGTPGETVNLDSRIQFVEDIAFPATVNGVSPSGAPYRVFRTEVPINQLAWDVSTTPVNSVNSNVAVRRNAVPSEWTCDAFSEASGTVTDSVTLVPDYLSNGTWFITVYGDESFSCNLRSGTPVVTPMAFSEAKTNDLPDRAGWRYYAVTDIPSQLGNLGWELLLSNQQPDTQISVRRNMIPGRWQSRTNGHTGDSHNTYAGETGHYGFIQRPAHQADVWYVGVYRPQQALGAFGLDVHPLNPPVIALNGASVPVSGQKPGQWKFFRFDVPGGIKGWDLRVKDVSGPVPTMSIRRGELPPLLEPINWIYPWESTQWPEGYEWAAGLDWTRRNHNFDGTPGGGGSGQCLGQATRIRNLLRWHPKLL